MSHPLKGLCYVVSEAFYHVNGKYHGYKPCRARYRGKTHWWLKGPKGDIIDLTAKQFKRPYPYTRGKKGGWLTGDRPCKRTQALIKLLYGQSWPLLKKTLGLASSCVDWNMQESWNGFVSRLKLNEDNPALHTLRYGSKGSHPRA